MGFGESVHALLETYTNCLKLLTAFNGRKEGGDRQNSDALLRKSLRDDRAKVRRAYSSRRREGGRKYEKGGGKLPPMACWQMAGVNQLTTRM